MVLKWAFHREGCSIDKADSGANRRRSELLRGFFGAWNFSKVLRAELSISTLKGCFSLIKDLGGIQDIVVVGFSARNGDSCREVFHAR